MRHLIFIFLMLSLLSCSNNTKENSSTTDSINAIEDHPLQDTQVAPFPDGYAPPNAEIDSSQKTKDSVDSVRRH